VTSPVIVGAPNQIRYVIGDAVWPIGDGPKIIAHVVNTLGKWGAGFSGALSERWPSLVPLYRNWVRRFV
jgi:hypothetical protein